MAEGVRLDWKGLTGWTEWLAELRGRGKMCHVEHFKVERGEASEGSQGKMCHVEHFPNLGILGGLCHVAHFAFPATAVGRSPKKRGLHSGSASKCSTWHISRWSRPERSGGGSVAGEGQDALVGTGEGGGGCRPVEAVAGGGLEGGEAGQGSERGEPAGGSDEPGSEGDSVLHVIDGAEGDAVEALGEGFGAGGVDAGMEAEGADGYLKEGGFLRLGFSEGDGERGAADGDGDARQAGSGAEVEEGGKACGQSAGGGDGFEKMAAEDRFRIADGSQIDAGAPVEEERQVVANSFIFSTLQRIKACAGEELMETRFYVR